jgi:hypothetical protein
VYYLSSCASGRITRILLADVSGHGELVAGTAKRPHSPPAQRPCFGGTRGFGNSRKVGQMPFRWQKLRGVRGGRSFRIMRVVLPQVRKQDPHRRAERAFPKVIRVRESFPGNPDRGSAGLELVTDPSCRLDEAIEGTSRAAFPALPRAGTLAVHELCQGTALACDMKH